MPRQPETIFITGFPGFIAGRLVERLADAETEFYLLVEPRFVPQAMREIEQICDRTGVPLENFSIIEGDITKPDLGISAQDMDVVRAFTTSLYHLAAVYDLAVAKDIAFKVNLDGTRNVNAFARLLPYLRRYNYISTCYVAGQREGRILETDLPHDAGFRNYYEETKYLAEMEVEELKKDLPVTIFRPAVVVGDSETGDIPKYDGIYYLIKYLRKAPGLLRLINVGNPDVRLNLVPVDFVVESIAALAVDENAAGKTIALADPAPLTTEEIFNAIAKSMTRMKSAYTPPAKLVKSSLLLPFSSALSGLPRSAVPYFYIAQTYDTAVANELLSAHKIECPRFTDYVGNLIEFVKKHPFANS